MDYKKVFIALVGIFIATGIYYRDYIPTTRSDFENLYSLLVSSIEQDKAGQDSYGIANPSSIENNKTEEQNTLSEEEIDKDNSVNFNSERVEQEESNLNKQKLLPETVNNFVPFTPQAPFGKWDQLHEEACEEASLVMAHYFIEGRELVLSKEAEKDIQDLTKYIKKDDISVGELKKIAQDYYKHTDWKIIEKPNTIDIKKELAQGNIIIIPLAGREIGNPYYKQPGPLYHMLVINGYNDKKSVFITQDPGTKRGKNYEYKYDTLLNANHDWTGDKNKIKEGVSRILIVGK